MMYLMVLGGFVLLFGGGELLVRGAVGVAHRLKISPLLIGLTIVAFCTSAPELLVSLEAATRGQPDISIGNIVGSNIANVLLILGAASVIWPITVDRFKIRRDMWVMLAAVSLLAGLGMTGEITRWQGWLMIGALMSYVAYSYWTEAYRAAPSGEIHEGKAEEFAGVTHRLWLAFVYLGLGLGALIIGSKILVSGAEEIARNFGVTEAVKG
nr:sodium:calcium antiporter [Actinomycetota bacterium]